MKIVIEKNLEIVPSKRIRIHVECILKHYFRFYTLINKKRKKNLNLQVGERYQILSSPFKFILII
jgi:hypothetical protein